MATTWVDVTDTAVKIGLGALIGGIFSVGLIFATSWKERLAERRTRRFTHFEAALLSAERYLNYLINNMSIAAWHRSSDLDSADLKQAKKEYDLSYARFDEAVLDLNTATSRLVLLNHEPIAKKLREASTLADKRLREIESGGSYDQQMRKFDRCRTELSEKRLEIMRLLREAYHR
jgi:hypothetical protein